MEVKNKVQLITYPDSLGGNLKKLYDHLQKHFDGLFGAIHILPPFPSSGDRGFAPVDYTKISPEFGEWEDIKRLGEEYDLALDLMVNHISARSEYFQDYLSKGDKSEYADMFLPLSKLWKDGVPKEGDMSKIFLRRECPYSEFTIKPTGERVNVWTTFGREEPSEQIDLDVHSPKTIELLQSFFEVFGKNKVSLVRLDAIGYVIKKIGSSCFFVEPEIYDFIDWISALASSHGIALLPEVHAEIETVYKLAKKGHWIYDFVTPYMVLDLILNKNKADFLAYLENRPQKQFTMLDCHDGVPVIPDVNGLYKPENAKAVVETCGLNGAFFSRVLSEEHKGPDGFDVHQINGTYYSLLGKNNDAYVTARAIQLFIPGIPQVYYVGLLAGENDIGKPGAYLDTRELNRHNYTDEEIRDALDRDIVKRLCSLIRFRNNNDIFNGSFRSLDNDNGFELVWEKDSRVCGLAVNLNTFVSQIYCRDENGNETKMII